MKALLVVAHGSRREASNEEVRALVESVQAHADNTYPMVGCGFLELAEPSIPEGLKRLIADGATDITIVPYFLSAGRHVSEDIPAEVQSLVGEFPAIRFHIAPYLGLSSSMAGLLLEQASAPE